MKIATFIKRNFIKIIVQTLLMIILFISFFSIEFSIESLKNDGKSVNYVGMIRGRTQLLVKQELFHNPNQVMIEELDNIIYQLKKHSDGNHFALHEEPKLQESLNTVELKWIELKDEIYKYRAGVDSIRLYNLSNEYYELADKLVFETQTYVESKVDKAASLRNRLMMSVILILIFNIHQFISKIYVQDKNVKLSSIAYCDSLTGLPNRSHCNAVISEYNAMDTMPNLACVYMDLNNLKTTNDLMGHDAGDRLIHNFGAILKEASEPYGFVCRNGGDEFVAIFENCTQKNINDYISYLNEKTKMHNSKEDIKISFAIGVAYSYEVSSNKINDILTLADKRMYENKADYKNKKINKIYFSKENFNF